MGKATGTNGKYRHHAVGKFGGALSPTILFQAIANGNIEIIKRSRKPLVHAPAADPSVRPGSRGKQFDA